MSTTTHRTVLAPPPVYVLEYADKLRSELAQTAYQRAEVAPLTQAAINTIYADLGLNEPLIIWCDSMLQFCNMPWMTSLLCKNKEVNARVDLIKRFTAIKRTKKVSSELKLADKFLEVAQLRLPENLGPILNSRLVNSFVKGLSADLASEAVSWIGEQQKLNLEGSIRYFVFLFVNRLRNSPLTWGQFVAFKGISQGLDTFTLPGDIQTMSEVGEAFQRGRAHWSDDDDDDERDEAGKDEIDHKDDKSSKPSGRLSPYTVFTNAWSANELYWLTNYDCLRSFFEVSFKERADNQLTDWMTLLRSGFAYMFFENICFVCAYPRSVSVDDRCKLHSPTAPAYVGAGGDAYYFWHGVRITEKLIKHRNLIKPFVIESQSDDRIRTVMIDMYGWHKYVRDAKAAKIHQDESGSLYCKEFKRGEPVMFVEFFYTAADGTTTRSVMRVPPTMKTARAAVAWTDDVTKEKYVVTQDS